MCSWMNLELEAQAELLSWSWVGDVITSSSSPTLNQTKNLFSNSASLHNDLKSKSSTHQVIELHLKWFSFIIEKNSESLRHWSRLCLCGNIKIMWYADHRCFANCVFKTNRKSLIQRDGMGSFKRTTGCDDEHLERKKVCCCDGRRVQPSNKTKEFS